MFPGKEAVYQGFVLCNRASDRSVEHSGILLDPCAFGVQADLESVITQILNARPKVRRRIPPQLCIEARPMVESRLRTRASGAPGLLHAISRINNLRQSRSAK